MEIVNSRSTYEAPDHHFPLADYFNFDVRPFTTMIQFAAEEPLLSEGQSCEYLFYLIDGRAKLYLSHENGRISLINFLTAPCFIGEMELLGAQSAPNGVTAITPCTCYAIRIASCRERLLHDTRFLRHLCLFLSRKAIQNTANYSSNQSYPLEVRLANFILLSASRQYYRERHTEAAEYLGVSYRHLLYVLADFTKKGLLIKTEQGYYIPDLNALQAINRKPLEVER